MEVAKNTEETSTAGQATAIYGAENSPRAEEAHKIVERFAAAYVELGTWAAAYRRCYDVSRMSASSVWQNARAMSQYPGVRERVRELLAEGAERSIVSVAEALKHQFEIATADPNEIVWVSEHNCRRCWGVDGAYQWRDPDEFAEACATELDAAVMQKRVPKLPTDEGGYGFTVHRPPNPDCETCAGAGQPRVHVADTRKLQGPAAKLIKSVGMDRFGQIKVELHDQQKAWDAVNRILGAYKDSLTVKDSKPAEEIPPDTPPEKVAEAYLTLVQ